MTQTQFQNAKSLAELAEKLDDIGRSLIIAFGDGVIAGRKSRKEESEDAGTEKD